MNAGAVGFIETRFEHERHIEFVGDVCQTLADVNDQLFRFDDTGARDE